MTSTDSVEDDLEKARDAEEHARNTTDPELKARWLAIAFGYRELARFRQQVADTVSVIPPQPPRSRDFSGALNWEDWENFGRNLPCDVASSFEL
jgi:hypothetical protein